MCAWASFLCCMPGFFGRRGGDDYASISPLSEKRLSAFKRNQTLAKELLDRMTEAKNIWVTEYLPRNGADGNLCWVDWHYREIAS